MIAAEGEHKASRALKHAAEVIADSPAALQVVAIIVVIVIIILLVIIIFIITILLLLIVFLIIIAIIIIIIIICNVIFSAALPSNFKQHLSREQQHDHLSSPN